MEIFAHALWTHAVYETVARTRKKTRTKKEVLLTMLFGIAPDLVSFGFLFITKIFTSIGWLHAGERLYSEWKNALPSLFDSRMMFYEPPDPLIIPSYVYRLYNVSHSLLIFALVFLLIWMIRRKPYWPLAGWGLHIMIDVFSHTNAFFPTPIFFPFSGFHLTGVNWANPYFMLINYSSLLTVYLFLHYFHPEKKRIAPQR